MARTAGNTPSVCSEMLRCYTTRCSLHREKSVQTLIEVTQFCCCSGREISPPPLIILDAFFLLKIKNDFCLSSLKRVLPPNPPHRCQLVFIQEGVTVLPCWPYLLPWEQRKLFNLNWENEYKERHKLNLPRIQQLRMFLLGFFFPPTGAVGWKSQTQNLLPTPYKLFQEEKF